METVSVYEAKTHLSKLLERVTKGERFTITKHGAPIALLQPPPSQKKSSPKEIIKELQVFRNKHILSGLSIRQMIEEGRR